VIRNLLSNSIKFTPENGRITILTISNDNELRLSISDTGPGFDPKMAPLLMQGKYRPHQEGTEHEKGSGIGLTMSQDFIKLIGGSIDVESKVGKGSTFTIFLPIKSKVIEQ